MQQSLVKPKKFVFLGGFPILDLCNTLLIHLDSKIDFLQSQDDLRDWLKALKKTYRIEQSIPVVSEQQYLELISFRGALRDYFQSHFELDLVEKKRAIKRLNLFMKDLVFARKIGFVDGKDVLLSKNKYLRSTPLAFATECLDSMFASADLGRVKRCSNPNCSHFFYDKSKNRSRDWCSMKGCGNIMKVRAFYRRSREI
jgi:predicted RNA-binding Zn ribbon-like protein